MREDLCARLKFGLPVFGGVHREENDDNSGPSSFKFIPFFFFHVVFLQSTTKKCIHTCVSGSCSRTLCLDLHNVNLKKQYSYVLLLSL